MSSQSPVRILFVGDMHLGRRASRVPDKACELGGFDRDDLGPREAWQRVVRAALDAGVQAVALAGDLVDQDDDLFEARVLLERGIRQLTDAGIAVVAVAGNHDTRIMPTLTGIIDGLHLLGPGGTWGAFTVAPGVRLVGWSFPTPHYTTSPLDQAPPPATDGQVTLGLLHADLDVARSDYAPVTTAALNRTGYQGWALGHIHAPDPVPGPETSRQPFYLGSISGAIPTETGAHGPVLATVAADGHVSWERLVLAPLRWEHFPVPVDLLVSAADSRDVDTDLRNFLLTWINALDLGADWAGQNALALGLRLTLTGSHPRAVAIAAAVDSLAADKLVTLANERVVFVEKIVCDVAVPLDLEDLANRNDPPGLLAREILALRRGAPTVEPLLAEARQALTRLNLPTGQASGTWTDAELRQHLARVGQRALNALLEQDSGGPS